LSEYAAGFQANSPPFDARNLTTHRCARIGSKKALFWLLLEALAANSWSGQLQMIFVATQESIGEAPSMRGLDLPGLHDTTNILHTRLVCLFCHGLESITLARLSRLFDVCSAKSLNDGSCLL
jgi:hypothetical protein